MGCRRMGPRGGAEGEGERVSEYLYTSCEFCLALIREEDAMNCSVCGYRLCEKHYADEKHQCGGYL